MSLNGFRSRVRSFVLGVRRALDGREVPVIMTKDGPVTESARLQAAINMKMRPDIKAAVEAQIAREFGGNIVKGIMEARRRYPEGYED